MENITIIDIITIAFSMIAALFSAITYYKNIVHDRKQATLEAFNQLQEQVLDKLNLYKNDKIAEIAQNRRSEEYKIVSGYIARIEHFCVGVNQKIYDKKTVYQLAHGYLDGVIKKKISPILDRKSIGDEVYYENMLKVFNWMDEKSGKYEAIK